MTGSVLYLWESGTRSDDTQEWEINLLNCKGRGWTKVLER